MREMSFPSIYVMYCAHNYVAEYLIVIVMNQCLSNMFIIVHQEDDSTGAHSVRLNLWHLMTTTKHV